VPKPGWQLERIGVRCFFDRGGGAGNRQSQLPVAMVELPNENIVCVGHHDATDNSIPLAYHPSRLFALAAGRHVRIPSMKRSTAIQLGFPKAQLR